MAQLGTKEGRDRIAKVGSDVTESTSRDIPVILQETFLTPEALGLAPLILLTAGAGRGKGLPQLRTLEIPTTKGRVNVDILGFETTSGRSVILGGRTPEGVRLGTPKVIEFLRDLEPTGEIKVGSALETKTLSKALEDAPGTTVRARTLIEIAQEILGKTKGTKSTFIEDFPSRTERLDAAGVDTILEATKANEGKIFGSFSRSAQTVKEFTKAGETFEITKIPRDLDVLFETKSDAQVQRITQDVFKDLQEQGKTVRIRSDDPAAIDILTPEGFRKAVEFKSKDTANIVEGEQVPDFIVGFQKTGKPIKIDGISTTGLAEELRGVTQGVIRIRKDPSGQIDIFPSLKRTKDISSVSIAARTLEQSKTKPGLLDAIERFENL